MEVYFNNSILSDVQLVLTDGKDRRQIHAHKIILAAKSDFFLTMFTSGYKEASSSVVEVQVRNVDTALAIIKSMYTSNVELYSDLDGFVEQSDAWLIPKKYASTYLGDQGVFQQVEWNCPFICTQSLRFMPESDQSTIQDIRMLRYVTNTHSVAISFRHNTMAFLDYLKRHDITLTEYELRQSTVYFDSQYNLSNLRKLLCLVLETNVFSPEDLIEIRDFYLPVFDITSSQ